MRFIRRLIIGTAQWVALLSIFVVTFSGVRKRAARMGRNPATGEAIKIKASKKVAFRATKELKMAI